MKQVILSVFFLLVCFVSIEAQDEPKVCISQEAANKCATLASELIEARKVIQNFLAERGAKDAQIATLTAMNQGLKEINELSLDIEKAKDRLIAVHLRVIEMYEKLVTTLENRLYGKRKWYDKLFAVLKRMGDILLGVGVGALLK